MLFQIGLWRCIRIKFTVVWFQQIIQGDQKVSVHLMITIQKVTNNVQSVPLPVSRHLLTPGTVFSKTVFGIARSTFRIYSVMAVFNSSVVWGLFSTVIVRCTETFWSPCINFFFLGRFSSIEVYENPSSGSRVVPCGQTDRQAWRHS